MGDAWSILKHLTEGKSLSDVSVLVILDGQEVPVSGRHFAWLLEERERDKVPPQDVPGMQAAAAIAGVGSSEVSELVQKAAEGQPGAQRAIVALVLYDLIKHRVQAKNLVLALRNREPKAIALARTIRAQVKRGNEKAQITLFLIQDASRELDRQLQEAVVEQSEEKEAAPEEATA